MEGNDENLKNWEPGNVDPPFILRRTLYYFRRKLLRRTLYSRNSLRCYDSHGSNLAISFRKLIYLQNSMDRAIRSNIRYLC